MSRSGLLRCAAAAVLFGVSAPFASRLADDMNAFVLAGLLYLGAALATAVPAVRTSMPVAAVRRKAATNLATAVVAGGAVGPLLLAMGLRRVSAPTASLLLNLELVFTAVFAGLLFREHLGGRVVAGTAIVLAAGVVLGWSGDAELRWGAALIAAACVCWALDNCVTASIEGFTPAQITFVKGTIAGGGNLLIGLAVGGTLSVVAALWAVVLGTFGYGASITLWVAGARELGAARAQLVFATAPFIGAVVAWTVLSDPVQGRQVAALSIALAGVAFVLHSAHEHAHGHEGTVHSHPHVPDRDHRHEHRQR